MKTGVVLLRVTAAVLGVQLLLGGLLTFGFVSPAVHIAVGFVLLVLALGAMVVWFRAKPAYRQMRLATAVIVLLLLLQVVLGFAALDTGSQALAFAHFANAMAIFGATISGTFAALRWEQTQGLARD